VRGGSWLGADDLAAAVVRNWYNANFRIGHLGFRVVVCAVPVS
jgi:formylglycine-generating enzyme required for sulfatase activity